MDSFFDEFDDIYNTWVDEVNDIPLTRMRSSRPELSDVLQINRRLLSHVHELRQHFEEPRGFERNPTTILQGFTLNPGNAMIETSWSNQGSSNMSIFESNDLFTNVFNIFNNVIYENMVDEQEDVKVVLTHDDFNKLTHNTVHAQNLNNYETKTCNVCLDNFNIDDTVTQLQCKHTYHKACIQEWLCSQKTTCPVCRTDTRT